MNKKTELQVMERIAHGILPAGLKVTRNSMEFARVDEDALQSAGIFLQMIDAACAWWWGDFLAAYCGFRLKRDEQDNGGQFDELTRQDRVRNYGADYSRICGREASTLWHWKGVADFYESCRRRQDLTWSHHIEAKNGSKGDKAEADNWLDLAEKHRWSASELRAQIRKTKRAEDSEGPAAQTLLPIELVQCRRFASAHIARVAEMDVEEAAAWLAELEQTHALIQALVRRVSPTLSSLPSPGSAKESLSA